MRFSVLPTALALVLSVNTAAVSKRAVSAPVQTCINDLSAVAPQLTVVTNYATNFTADQGWPSLVDIYYQEIDIETQLNTTRDDCCPVTTTVTQEEANAIITEVGPLTTEYETTLQTLIEKKSEFDKILLASVIMKGYFRRLSENTTPVTTCLVTNTPAYLASAAQGYVDRINAASATFLAAYA